jgi:hypothetical protein
MFFTLPWMLLGLIGLPALAGIYWLRSRAKPKTVSSLFLWADQRQPRQGGRIFQKLQTPLTFFLEMIALACLALAAASPVFIRSQQARPLVIVLDDSYSMQAVSGKDSARQRGLDRIQRELRRRNYVARVILAGQRPNVLGIILRTPDQLEEVAREWTCQSPVANLESAIALASEIGGTNSLILVVSDHEPAFELPAQHVRWWSVGQSASNIAITAASRDAHLTATGDVADRVLIELSNLGNQSATTQLVISQGTDTPASSRQIDLPAGGVSRMVLTVPEASPLMATLPADALDFDNRALLLSPRRPPLRVQVDIPDAEPFASLRASVIRALNATGLASAVSTRPELIITNRSIGETAINAHRLEILTGEDPVSFEGPFVVNRTHPLLEGVLLDALIWTVAGNRTPDGTPLILAGNRVLVAENETPTGKLVLQMALEPELSTLTESLDWPIFMTNLVRWCQSSRPGPKEVNVRLGQPVTIHLTEESAATGQASLTLPDATRQTIRIHNQQLEFETLLPGLYQVSSGPSKYEVACNVLQTDESDLRRAVTGEWGEWNETDSEFDQRMNLDWAFILVVLACLIAELTILARSGGAGV